MSDQPETANHLAITRTGAPSCARLEVLSRRHSRGLCNQYERLHAGCDHRNPRSAIRWGPGCRAYSTSVSPCRTWSARTNSTLRCSVEPKSSVMATSKATPSRTHCLADQEILANELGVNPRTIGVPDLRGGAQRLDVRFIQFDNVVIELLQYRDADQPMGGPKAFAEPVEHMSPAFPRMMHICFYVRDDVDFNQFIADLEAEFARRGMTQVRANRIIRVSTEEERKGAPQRQHQQGDGCPVRRLGTDLLQGPRGRTA